MKKFVVGFALLLCLPGTVSAGCTMEYNICESACNIKYLNDDAASAGCVSRCIGERAACLARVGVDKTAEASEKALESTKSFIKGLSEE